jgi:basic membrane lipoprotein Med (substrate-binding protein (PBP1-ABC) superfamily)
MSNQVKSKRLLEVLDEMNIIDAETGSQNVGVYNQVVSVNSYKDHGHVTIGVSVDTAQELLGLKKSNKRAILLIVDMDVYNKLS